MFISLFNQIIFVLRKKNNQITFLHVYHHLTMIFVAWFVAKYVPGGQCKQFFFGIIFEKILFSIIYWHYKFFCSCYHVYLLWFKCLWISYSKISLVETLFNTNSNCKIIILKGFVFISFYIDSICCDNYSFNC